MIWEEPKNDGGSVILQYEYRVDGRDPWTSTAPYQVTVRNLVNGQSYGFEVRAENAQGAGEAATAMATPSEKPSVPTLSATRGNRQVMLTWEKPSDGGSRILNYEYCVSTMAQRCDVVKWTSTYLVREKLVTGLDNGTEYVFNVRAVNMRGYGAVDTVKATPSERPPAPDGLQATPGDGKVTLSWNAKEKFRYEYCFGAAEAPP